MQRCTLVYPFAFLLVLVSCNKEEAIGPEDKLECLEGWYPSQDGSSAYYLDCADEIDPNKSCFRSFFVFLTAENYRGHDKAVFSVKSFHNEINVGEYSIEVEIRTQLLLVEIEFDAEKRYTHEVSITTPSTSCFVNSEKQSYTFNVEMPCFSVVELPFRILCG